MMRRRGLIILAVVRCDFFVCSLNFRRDLVARLDSVSCRMVVALVIVCFGEDRSDGRTVECGSH